MRVARILVVSEMLDMAGGAQGIAAMMIRPAPTIGALIASTEFLPRRMSSFRTCTLAPQAG